MGPRLTEALAIWGALISTIALLWQIFQWMLTKPRIAVKAQMIEGFSSDDGDRIMFELRNRGRLPTTVEEIMLVEHRTWWSRLSRYPDIIENVWVGEEVTMKVPVVLEPGEVWKGSCPLERKNETRSALHGRTRRERLVTDQLFYRIRCAHTDRLIKGKVRPEPFLERM